MNKNRYWFNFKNLHFNYSLNFNYFFSHLKFPLLKNINIAFNQNNPYDNDYNSTNNYYNNTYYDNSYQNDYNNPTKNNKKKNKKKYTFWASLLGVAGAAVVTIGVIWIIKYDFNNKSNDDTTTTTGSDEITTQYMQSTSSTAISAMKYIANRSFSMQFIFQPNHTNQNSYAYIISGTGWIFNKASDSETYYVATNIHVAAALTFGGNYISEYDYNSNSYEYTDFRNYSLTLTYIGYVDINSKSGTNVYEQTNLNMVSVSTPTIAYLADTSFYSDSSFATNYSDLSFINSDYHSAIDFSLLKFDFSDISDSGFKSWLNYYDNTPTTFLSDPFALTSNSNSSFYNYTYYMGGFPADQTESGFNYAGARWIGLSNFKSATKANKLITVSNYLPAASGAGEYYDENDTEWLEASKISYFKGNEDQKYLNVGLNGLFTANSAGGASGSMIVVDTGSNNFAVAAIYWGSQTFTYSLEDDSTSQTVGSGNLLNISSYSYYDYDANYTLTHYSFEGFDIFADASNVIKNESASLVYNYISSNSLITN